MTSALDGGERFHPCPGHFIPGELAPGPIRYEAGWPESQSGRCGVQKNLLPLPTIEPRPVARRYTD
jgi:hypothetical protein